VDGPQTLGKYDILNVLGVGGMGTVYRARDRVLERIVAVKLLHAVSDRRLGAEDHGTRFLNEARAVARLNHPNIVSLFEFSDDDPAGTFFAMEYVDGRTVADYLPEDSEVRVRYAIPLIRQLLDGLDYAHANGVIHRDIKPSNLLVTDEHRLKISDFGIAKIGSTRHTSTGLMVGTPAYMAPERFRGDEIDRRCDVYSAAVVFYELLTGRRPFSGELTEIVYQICHVTPSAGSTVERAVPAALDPVLAKGLAKDPNARYQTAGEFAAAIAAASGAHAVSGAHTVSGERGNRGLATTEIDFEAEPTRSVGIAPTVLMTQHRPRSDRAPTPELQSKRSDAPRGCTPEQLADIERHLTPILGPMARIVVKRAAALTGNREQLCRSLEGYLRTDEERKRFLRDVSMESRTDTLAAQKTAPAADPGAKPAIGVIAPESQDRTTTILMRYIGPIATILVKKTAQLAIDETDFYQRLTERITDERERARCMAELTRAKEI
jgi:serine/threonine protein kinase